jgi:hypothetical protein
MRRRSSSLPVTPPLTALAPQPPANPGSHQSFPPTGEPTKHNSTVSFSGRPTTEVYESLPPPSPAQPYYAWGQEAQPGQAGYHHGPEYTQENATPVTALEYTTSGTLLPVSPSTTTMGAHTSYQSIPGHMVHEIGDGGHRGTMSELP